MVSIKINDSLFAHAKYSTDFQESKYINWNRSHVYGNEDAVIYTDNSLGSVNSNIKTKICWLLESPAVSSHQHEWIKSNHNKFDIVFTNNKDLLKIDTNFTEDNINSGAKFKFLPTGGCWIKPEDQRIWDKNSIVSMISSNKDFTDGHRMRNDILNNISGLDIFGRGRNPIDYKLGGLKNYMFSIVVENTKKDYYFTEKIIDCFATGTVPIYWGCPAISDTFMFFDKRGILSFDTLDELKDIISNLSPELYDSKKEYVENNFFKMKEYLIAEDYMWEKYLYEFY